MPQGRLKNVVRGKQLIGCCKRRRGINSLSPSFLLSAVSSNLLLRGSVCCVLVLFERGMKESEKVPPGGLLPGEVGVGVLVAAHVKPGKQTETVGFA